MKSDPTNETTSSLNNLQKRQGRRGIALVMVLAFVVLLTGLVVAYFARTMTDRQLSNSSFNQAAADQLANSALAIITGGLKQEIVKGSTPLPNPNPSNYPLIYVPSSNVNMVPVRNGVPDNWSTTGVVNTTLLRISTPTAIPASGPGVDQQASNAPTTGTSANGRSISVDRWNRHYLIPLQNTGATTDTTPDKNFTPPSWVYVTGTGPATLTVPNSSVIGRYAYAIYDEGALLDANVAGFPSTSGTSMPPQYVSKGSLAFADLSVLGQRKLAPQAAGINNLVGWRNYGSMQPTDTFPNLTFTGTTTVPNNYKSLVTSNTTGFLVVSGSTSNGLTDQAFMSRQELINLVLATGSTAFSPNALQYLGTFSRAVSAPSWSPTADASTLGGTNGSIYAYKDNAEFPVVSGTNNPNRDMANVRFQNSGTVTHWSDGIVSGSGTMIAPMTSGTYAVNAGDPLLQSRFSLAKIAWLSQADPTTGKLADVSGTYAQAIQACFGLTWGKQGAANGGNALWSYVGPAGASISGTIETLDQVAAEKPPREPNFFELLKAAILNGSLGVNGGSAGYKNVTDSNDYMGGYDYKGGGTPNYGDPLDGCDGAYSYTLDAGGGKVPSPTRIPDMQVIQIGANIIDQYDIDSYPTAIYFKCITNPKYDAATGANDIVGARDVAYGDENLPELLGMVVLSATVDGKPITQGTAVGSTAGLADWWQPNIWNPHQIPNSKNPAIASGTTMNFQIQGHGNVKLYWAGEPEDNQPVSLDNVPPQPGNTAAQTITFTDKSVPPSYSSFYSEPLLLTTDGIPTVSKVTESVPQMAGSTYPGYAGQMEYYSYNHFVGFWAGLDKNYKGAVYDQNTEGVDETVPATFCLGWLDPSGGFHPYSYIAGIFAYTYAVIDNQQWEGSPAALPCGSVLPEVISAESHSLIDPRTARFSSYCCWGTGSSLAFPYVRSVPTLFSTLQVITINPNAPGNVDCYGWGQPGHLATNFYYTAGPHNFGYPLADWEVNQKGQSSTLVTQNSSSNTFYTDLDGVIRPGDGPFGDAKYGDGMLLFSGSAGVGTNPASTAAGDTASGGYDGNSSHGRRPVILNRPFRSVGELGYTFRDEPFKSLDFFSTASADAALLDVFSTADQARVVSGQLISVVAGQVDLNNSPAPVIQAILSGGSKKDADPTYNIAGSPTAQNLAQDIVTALNPSTGVPDPLSNRADLVTRLGAVATSGTGVILNGLGNTTSPDRCNKAYIEGPIRALADVTNTRTWNLMIDVIAQTGGFSGNTTDLNRGFNVQGERHYWLHIAIDRFTGKVVDQQLEPVYE